MKKLIITLALILATCAPALADDLVIVNKTGENARLIITMPDDGDTRVSTAFRAGGNMWQVFDEKGGMTTVFDYSDRDRFQSDRDDD